MLEDKMTKAQIVKDDAKIDKYNVDAITSFIKTILADLGETYRRSSIGQLKILLGSVFPYGIAWDYSGTLNPEISPIFQVIQHFEEGVDPFGAENGTRTRDLLLGKQTLYQLSYFRKCWCFLLYHRAAPIWRQLVPS